MLRRLTVLLAFLTLFSGCGPSPKEKYDDAVRELEQAQSRLDNLRPAYDQARQTAANAVCREIAGTTPEESASAALQGLGNVLNQPAPATTDQSKKEEAKKNETGKKVATGRRGDELDKTIDGLIAAEKNAQQKESALTAPVAKAEEVMTKINTPRTPEHKRYEEKLNSMPEVQAYNRQQRRVEGAKKDVDEAKKALPQ
ncbi:MAG TPA: hypothetical protein VFW73_11050 [Lacipirellulaceae bacterium]|nr:hypothetical protein [Lacipirellulaceae bacterium]